MPKAKQANRATPAGLTAEPAAGPVAKATRVLLVEDNPGDAGLIKTFLASAGARFSLAHAKTLAEGLQALSRGGVDVILLDLNTPDSWGLATLASARAAAPTAPIIVLTGMDERDLILRAVREGAQDYLIKGEIDARLLERSIHYAIERQRLLLELERKYEKELELGRFKTQLVSMVSHEFANSLSVVACGLPFLRETSGEGLTRQRKDLYETIERSVCALNVTAHNLLNLGRLENGKLSVELRSTEIGSLLRESLRFLKILYERKGIRVALELPEEPLVVKADPEALSLVLSNLVNNAIKYTPEGGRITVGASLEAANPDRAVVFVEDTGIGIPRHEQRKIFSGYYRTRGGKKAAQGFGMGLVFAKTIIAAHGSAVKVRSAPGKGSRFYFTLPLWSGACGARL